MIGNKIYRECATEIAGIAGTKIIAYYLRYRFRKTAVLAILLIIGHVLFIGNAGAIAEPNISVSSDSFDFGEVIFGSNSTEVVSIFNNGSIDLKIETLSITGWNSVDFRIENNLSGQTIPPGEKRQIQIVFYPQHVYSGEPDFITDPYSYSNLRTGFHYNSGMLSGQSVYSYLFNRGGSGNISYVVNASNSFVGGVYKTTRNIRVHAGDRYELTTYVPLRCYIYNPLPPYLCMGLEGFVYSAYFPKYYVDSYAGTGFSVAGFISPELTRVPDAFLEIISNDTDSQSLSISLFGSEISVSGDISYVDDGFVDDPVSHKWNSITKGIYYVRPGGTVIVYDGTYLENVVVGDTITLKGIGMPVIDARGSRSPITISHDGATIDGFFIMGSEKSYPNAGISINSNNNTIVNNTISNNFKGIHVISGTNNTIDGNNISFNRISELSDGIYIESSNNNVINNYIEGNRDEGIQIYSDDNNIIGNTVVSNGNSNNNTGISIDYGSNNHLYHNNLINNSINANDVSSNIWDSGTEGNYWSDYSGIDSNSDGIGDTPYSIAGGDNKDNYPFMQLNGWLSITPPISATSAPTIDGVINSGEWLNKTSITLNGYYQPSNLKYGDLYVMNDDNNIYVAVVIPDTNEDSDYLMLDFDNGDDHIASTGREDAVGFNVAQLYGGTAGYLDYYWDGFWWAEDSMRHGAGAMAFLDGNYSYEFSKPLNSGDLQDMTLHLGDTVGFRIETRDGTLNDWYRYPQNTVDADTSQWAYWTNLDIEVPAAVTLTGDVNGDGILSSVDALMALQMSAGNIAQDLAADVSGDGSVTALDALMILQASVGAIVL